jgi:FixJ family two-component response regulator
MSGIELQIGSLPLVTRFIIFMTAFPEERTKARAIKAGAFGFLTAVRAEHLMDCVHSALRKLKARGNLLDAPAFKAAAGGFHRQPAALTAPDRCCLCRPVGIE